MAKNQGKGRKKWFWKAVLYLVAAALLVVSCYAAFGRALMLRWGATDAEVAMALPGDQYVPEGAANYYTYIHAVTIDAPPDYAWPYIVQMGYQRAGWYNLDFINNAAANGKYFYENNRSADRVIPELQSLKVGDKIWLVPNVIGMEVKELVPNQTLLLYGGTEEKADVTWLYSLQPVGDNKTRLIVRWRETQKDDFTTKLMNTLITEPGGCGVQQTLNLNGIKSRAERDYSKVVGK